MIGRICIFFILTLALAGRAAEPIAIGVSGPLSGGSAAMGLSMRQGVELAASEINAKGGVLGRPIKLVLRDDEGRNEVGIQVSQELIDKEHVVATVGFVNTGVALAAHRFYQEAEIPVISCGTTGTVVSKQFLPPDYEHNYVFRPGLYDSLQADKMVDEAVTRQHLTKLAILADSTNYGQLGRADLETVLSQRGIAPVAVEKFNIKDVDMTAQLLRAKQAGAQAILTYGIGPELGQIANGMAKLGWKPPMISSNPMGMSSFLEIAGANAEGGRMVQSFIPDSSIPRHKAFMEAIAKQYSGAPTGNPPVAAQCHDSLLVLAAAIAQAKSTKGDKIRDALETLDQPVEGVIRTYQRPFTPTDHDGFPPQLAVIGVYRNGVITYAHDEERPK